MVGRIALSMTAIRLRGLLMRVTFGHFGTLLHCFTCNKFANHNRNGIRKISWGKHVDISQKFLLLPS